LHVVGTKKNRSFKRRLLSTGFNMLLLFVSDGNFFRDFAWGLLLLLIMMSTSRLQGGR